MSLPAVPKSLMVRDLGEPSLASSSYRSRVAAALLAEEEDKKKRERMMLYGVLGLGAVGVVGYFLWRRRRI
jgi:hypothetical protein